MPQKPRTIKSVRSIRPSGVEGLQRLFAQLNHELFDGKLPVYRVRFSPQVKGSLWGVCDPKPKVITLRPTLQGKDLRDTLIHEMCHIGTGPEHGKPWQARMLAVADRGEHWAREEVESYLRSPTWNQAMAELRKQVYNTVAECEELGRPHPTFREMLSSVATGFGWPPSALYKSAPWLKAAYKKVRRQVVREHEQEKLLDAVFRRQGVVLSDK